MDKKKLYIILHNGINKSWSSTIAAEMDVRLQAHKKHDMKLVSERTINTMVEINDLLAEIYRLVETL